MVCCHPHIMLAYTYFFLSVTDKLCRRNYSDLLLLRYYLVGTPQRSGRDYTNLAVLLKMLDMDVVICAHAYIQTSNILKQDTSKVLVISYVKFNKKFHCPHLVTSFASLRSFCIHPV